MIEQIVTLTGPSGSGKSTAERILAEQHGFGRVISHTSRAPRPGEVNGEHYHFVSSDEFPVTMGDLKNWVEFVEFTGKYYGVHRSEIDRLAGEGFNRIVIVCEPHGAKQVAHWCRKEHVQCVNAYFDTPIKECYNRYLRRFIAEDMLNPQVIDTYSARFANMAAESQWLGQWSEIAWKRIDTLGGQDAVDKLLQLIQRNC